MLQRSIHPPAYALHVATVDLVDVHLCADETVVGCVFDVWLVLVFVGPRDFGCDCVMTEGGELWEREILIEFSTASSADWHV